jgi:FKBP-type peptidyl-prolyl cis-trans isomerase
MKPSPLLALILLAPLAGCFDKTEAPATSKLETVETKASYSFGVDFATRLKQQSITLETESLIQGIRDASSGAETQLSEEEMNTARTEFLKKLREDMVAKQAAEGEKNLADGMAFLAENAKKEGVITTASGLQYKIITPGTGASPTLEDTVTTDYRGTVIDGREFDSSYARGKPATFPVKGVIKGWTEALQLMKVGAKWQLFIPADLAYGANARSEVIGPNATLIFDIELLNIEGQDKPTAKAMDKK